jgi:signal transduction histidine kinase
MSFTVKTDLQENTDNTPNQDSAASPTASDTTVSLDNDLLLEELRRQSRELELFQQIRTAMFYSLDLDRLFDTVLRTIANGFDFPLASIYLLENEQLKIKAQQGYERFYNTLELTQGITGKTARTGQPIFVTALQTQPDKDYLEVMAGVDSQICVPLVNRGREVLGTFGVESYKTRPLTQHDFNLCLALAEQIVLVMEHALSFKREQRRTDQFRLLNKVGRDLASNLDVQTIIDRVTGPVRISLGLYSVFIGLVMGDELVYRRSEGSNMQEPQVRRSLKVECVSSRSVRTGEFILVQDVNTEPGYLPVTPDPNIKSQVIIPLRTEGRVLGVIEVESDRLYAFDDDDVILLRTLADQTSVALTNAARFERLKRQSAELAEKNEQLEEASRLKSEFIANISHELRTPLNSIIGYMDMLRDGFYGEVPSSFNDPGERITRNSHQLLALINDVLDLSKMEAGKMNLDCEPFLIKELITNVCEATESQAKIKKLEFSSIIDPEVPRVVVNDQLRLRQVLLNLLSNAIKFTRQGFVKVEVKLGPPTALPNNVDKVYSISVSDSGIGIAEGEYQHIFEEFRQVDGSATREFGGTGLGLAISRRIVRMMGGSITVESREGVGSTFTVTLPLEVKLQTNDMLR